MLTTIGAKIIEIRPKQIIQSDALIDNNYLVPLNKKSDPHYTPVKKKEVVENEKLPERPSKHTETKA